LLFKPTVVRFPPLGLGEPGSENKFVAVLAPKEPPPLSEDLRPPPKPLPLLENNGLPEGEYGDPEPPIVLCTRGLPLPDRGELAKLPLLPTEPAIEGVREYRGGVLKVAFGVGGAEEGGRPRSFR
jgi:hypothetical protein